MATKNDNTLAGADSMIVVYELAMLYAEELDLARATMKMIESAKIEEFKQTINRALAEDLMNQAQRNRRWERMIKMFARLMSGASPVSERLREKIILAALDGNLTEMESAFGIDE